MQVCRLYLSPLQGLGRGLAKASSAEHVEGLQGLSLMMLKQVQCPNWCECPRSDSLGTFLLLVCTNSVNQDGSGQYCIARKKYGSQWCTLMRNQSENLGKAAQWVLTAKEQRCCKLPLPVHVPLHYSGSPAFLSICRHRSATSRQEL